MESLDSTIVTTSLPAIALSFGQPTLRLTSLVTVYLVAMVAFVPTAAWASSRVGARNLFAGAIGVFTLASLVCGASPSYEVLLVARLVQGAAAAFMSPVGRLVVLRQTPKDYIINAIGLIVWPGLIAPVIGPPLGGLITTYASWRWIFLVNIPVGILGVLLVLRFVPADAKEAPVALDKIGFILNGTALATLIHGLLLAGHPDARVVDFGSYILIGLGLGALALRHARKHPSPMLDLAAIRVPTFALCTVTAGFLARIAISMTPFLLPLMFQIGFGQNALQAGVMLLVYMSGNLAMKSATTPMLRRFGFRDVLRVNGILCVASLDRLRHALAGNAHRRHLCGAVRRRHDAIDEFHVYHHTGVCRRPRQGPAKRIDPGGHGAAMRGRVRCRGSGVCAWDFAIAERRVAARAGRLPP